MAIDNQNKPKNIQELPTIKYDREQLVPEIIERKKWNLIYILLCVWGILLTTLIATWVGKIEELKKDIATASVRYCDYKPKIDRLRSVWENLKMNDLLVSQFMLESLFFTDAKSYEMINAIKSFFDSDSTKALVWNFQVHNVIMNSEVFNQEVVKWRKLNSMQVIPIRIEWRYSAFTDLTNMVSILKRMSPIISIDEINFQANNTVAFRGYIYNFQKNLFLYNYTDSYKEVNDILLAKEKFQKNKEIFAELLKDKDLQLDKMGITEIYDCKQYEDLLRLNNLALVKEREIKQCNDVEALITQNKSELDLSFQKFIQKASMSTKTKAYTAPQVDYSEDEVGVSCKDIAPIQTK